MSPSEILRWALASACQSKDITLAEWDKATAYLNKLEGVE